MDDQRGCGTITSLSNNSNFAHNYQQQLQQHLQQQQQQQQQQRSKSHIRQRQHSTGEEDDNTPSSSSTSSNSDSSSPLKDSAGGRQYASSCKTTITNNSSSSSSSCGISEQRKAMSAFLSENFDLQATPEGVIEMLAAAAAVNNNNKRKYQQIQQRLSNDEDQENQEQLIRSPPAYNNKENNSVNHHNTNRNQSMPIAMEGPQERQQLAESQPLQEQPSTSQRKQKLSETEEYIDCSDDADSSTRVRYTDGTHATTATTTNNHIVPITQSSNNSDKRSSRKQAQPKKIRAPPEVIVAMLRDKYLNRMVDQKLSCRTCANDKQRAAVMLVFNYHTKGSLALHQCWRHRKEVLHCPSCQCAFKRRSSLILHKRREHRNVKFNKRRGAERVSKQLKQQQQQQQQEKRSMKVLMPLVG
ncbi:unnamed protein product [Ceratitis capitata]|uniref:(Mediterranean fruit fly) hypothetical protein n=1 Tax=Ceratitis capitata TaxID=7213 RepID=A0A811UMZ1_CERCA|nr:unnamed protein product [Ceratitis capitata]